MQIRLTRLLLSTGLGLAAALLWLLVLAPGPAQGAAPAAPAAGGLVFTATSPADFPDINPGDGVCETQPHNGICTLRAAVMEANAHPGRDTIRLLPNTTYLLSLPATNNTGLFGDMSLADSQGGDLDITDSVDLLGAGPASSIINGNGDTIQDRVFQITGTNTFSGVTIEHGRGINIGGGVINYGRLTLTNSVIFSNTAQNINDWGGGLYNSGVLTISHSAIRDNTTGSSNAFGGGIYSQGTLLIADSTLSGNATSGLGGGLYLIGGPTLIMASTLSGNHGGQGGGIDQNGPTMVMLNSTIAGNFSDGAGGGIFADGGSTSLYNATVQGNLANSDLHGSANGGGVANDSNSTLTFINTLIVENYHVVVPGPLLEADDCAGGIISQSNNFLSAVDSLHCVVTGTYSADNPLLGPLQDNGGPTLTEALLPGSPAINAGSAGGCTDNVGGVLATDQRGALRHGACDAGAFEFYYLLGLPLVQR
jgi:hypothetical protein